MWPAIGAGISAIGSLAGGLFNSSSAAAQSRKQEAQFDAQMKRQDDYFHNAVAYRVADAKRAGVHPLAALGAQISTPPSVSVGGVSDTGIGDGLSRAGQDIGRAVGSMKREDEKLSAYSDALRALTLEKTRAEIDLIRSNISRNLPSVPAMPISTPGLKERWLDGQGNSPLSVDVARLINSPLIKEKAMERTPGDPGRLYQEPGAITDRGYARTADGNLMAVPSKDVKERIEDMFIQELTWFMRNNLLPGGEPYKAPRGQQWHTPIWGFGQYKLRDTPQSSREMLNRFRRGW